MYLTRMAKNPFLAILLLLTAAFAVLAPVHTATAMTAEEYFKDGNRLFRDDLFWAALLRYRQAADDGMDSALLHYNTGVAHYRARQYSRARESLRLALADPVLQASAQYNLGLNAYAAGSTEEALGWMRLVRDQQQTPNLQAYAVAAIARIRAAAGADDALQAGVFAPDNKRPFADLELRARIGFASDDNVFRSPNQSYVDFSNSARPLITPEAKSGTFVPLSLSAKYTVNSLPFEGFYGAYRLVGRY